MFCFLLLVCCKVPSSIPIVNSGGLKKVQLCFGFVLFFKGEKGLRIVQSDVH